MRRTVHGRKRLAIVAALALSGVLALAAPAGAVTPTGSCGYPTSQVFLPWGDVAEYWLVPGGDMEPSSSWTRSPGASLIQATSPLGVGSHSLGLKKGASSTSALFCVDVDSPTLRLFVKSPKQSSARLVVEILYTAENGNAKAKVIGTIAGGSNAWQLSPVLDLKLDQVAKKDASGTWQGQLRLRAESGQWVVDDVYADPFRRI